MQESTASDPTTRYAELVLAGEIMAGNVVLQVIMEPKKYRWFCYNFLFE